MSDDRYSDNPFVHNARPTPKRQPRPGEEVWRLRNDAGRVQSCELRDDSRSGAGWDLCVLEDGEILFSRRCANREQARLLAGYAADDMRRTGWT